MTWRIGKRQLALAARIQLPMRVRATYRTKSWGASGGSGRRPEATGHMSKSKQQSGVGFQSFATLFGIFFALSTLLTLAGCSSTGPEPTADAFLGTGDESARSTAGNSQTLGAGHELAAPVRSFAARQAAAHPNVGASNAQAQPAPTAVSPRSTPKPTPTPTPAIKALNNVSDPTTDGLGIPVPIVSSSASSSYDWRWPATASYDGDATTFWMTAGNSLNEGKDYMPWIEYTFDQVYSIGTMRVINFDGYEYLRGAKDVEVLVSQDGTTFTSLGYKQFLLGSSTTIDGTLITQGAVWQSFDLGGALAKYVKLAIHTNYYGWVYYGSPDLDGGTWGWANASITGLREAQFYAAIGNADCSSPNSNCVVRPVALVIPKTSSLSQLALFGNTVTIDSGVRVFSPSTGQAAAIAGGVGGVSIGAQSVVGGVTSNGNVSIASGVEIDGPVSAAGAVTNASTLVDAAKFEQNTGPQPTTQYVLNVAWPSIPSDALTVTNGQSISHLPGYYGAVTVAPGGTLQLLAGDHYMDSLSVQSGGHLRISNMAASVRIFLRGTLTFSGDLTQDSDDANVVFISSAPTVDLLASMRATVWAPNAQLNLAPGGVFTGSFIGDVVHVQPGALINREPTFQQPVIAYDVGSPGAPQECGPGGQYYRTHELTIDWSPLETTQDWVCFLSSVSGASGFFIGGPLVNMRQSNGYWIGSLEDESLGTATCLHKSCFASDQLRYSGPYSASASADFTPAQNILGVEIPSSCIGKQDQQLAGTNDEAAFITGFNTNHPQGTGEKFRVEQSSTGYSHIEAYDEQCDPGTVVGSAYSLRAGPLGQVALFDGPYASHAPIEQAGTFLIDSGHDDTGLNDMILAPVSDAVCYLSSIAGHFAGWGEAASIDVVPDGTGRLFWRLQVRHRQGGAPAGVQAEATCYARDQDICSSTVNSMDPSFCDPLIRQRFVWTQGQAVRAMGTASDRACFLTQLSGKFEGANERVAIERSNGGWVLGGISSQSGIFGEAQCVAAPSTSNEIIWNNSMDPVDLGPVDLPNGSGSAKHTACFLTSFSGRLGGGGEAVRVYQDSGRWWLSGRTQQSYITAAARCIPVESVGPEQVWGQGNPPLQLTEDPPNPRTVCFLTGVAGRFEGNGEAAQVTTAVGPSGALIQWLGGKSAQVDVESRAVCATLQTDPLAGPPEIPVEPGAPDCSLTSVAQPGDCPGFVFSNRFIGDDSQIDTSYSCRPLSCFQSGDPNFTAAQTPGKVAQANSECVVASQPLSGGDAVSQLLTFTAYGSFGPPATHGDGEWAKIVQQLDKDSPSLVQAQHCSDETLSGTGSSLLLNGEGKPVKFIGKNGVISAYNQSVDDFEVHSSTPPASTLMTPVATSTCVFTSTQGNFNGGGEYVSIDQTDIDGVDYWVLHGQHLSGTGVSATARCFPNNQADQ